MNKQKISLAALVTLFCIQLGAGQDFSKSPVKGVKTIVEWIQRTGVRGVQKGYVYRFHPKGHITSFINENDSYTGDFEYDRKTRLAKATFTQGTNETIKQYHYKQQFHSVEEGHKDNYMKSLLFYDTKKRLVEKKSFYKRAETNHEYKLFERFVYHYDDRDSLLGEMYYNYFNEKDKRTPYSRKTLHRYDKSTGKKVNITDFGYTRLWQVSTDFDYNKDGQLRKQTTSYRAGHQRVTIYEYKDGELWQEQTVESDATITKVYKNGRPIRKRSKWKNGDSEVIDYQYEFY